ncbi:MAG: V-type ATPase subunit [bacterium]|nr:V-type ATPase subunit [bacterium]
MLFTFGAYPAATARTRGLKARLLQPTDWQALGTAAHLTAALAYLGTTSYQTALAAATSQATTLPSLRTVEHALHSALIGDMINISRFVHGAAFNLLACLAQRYELINVTTQLRRLSQPERRTIHLATEPYQLGLLALTSSAAWGACTSLNDLGRMLEKTYLRNEFRLGLASFGDSHDLLRFESTLDTAYLHELLVRLVAVGDTCHQQMCRIIGSVLDELTLTGLARFRFVHGLEAAAVYSLLPLHGCGRLGERQFWELAKARTEDELCHALQTLPGWQALAGATLRDTVMHLRRARQVACRNVFLRATPISIAPVIAYFFIKEQEIMDLICTLQMKRFRIPFASERLVRAAA